MFELHQDEKSFWETMTPARLCKLIKAYYRPVGKATAENNETMRNGKPTRYVDLDIPAGNKKSLAQYFMGGE